MRSRSKCQLIRPQIWHGLGDRYDAVGLLALKHEIEQVPALKGVFVHLAYVEEEGSADS